MELSCVLEVEGTPIVVPASLKEGEGGTSHRVQCLPQAYSYTQPAPELRVPLYIMVGDDQHLDSRGDLHGKWLLTKGISKSQEVEGEGAIQDSLCFEGKASVPCLDFSLIHT